ncbi:putative methyltransferase-domain-containing protein [Zychaea mexicana]|uniref:putative methyltransferase-domain-containing protein n=1 Tax=Zychaea mexicana TaxID=64656 RepID=UPI0022FE79D2|nr:putative methyltransferase-domain-containing protein [Zychaea mexicana]KAI9498668.1 putative methyltransferase-domain-containing protein [Zychaea mexicana]
MCDQEVLLPEQILERLDTSVHQAQIRGKLDQDNGAEIDAALDMLEQLILWSYDRYTNIELEDGCEEEGEEQTYRVHPHDIVRANQICGSFLVKIVSGDWGEWQDDRVDKAARLLAHLSGRGAAGAITRTWHFPYLDPNGNRQEHRFKLHEPSYIGNDIGFKTWGAAPLLAKKLIQQNLIPDLPNRTILELGTGTGLVGLCCGKLGAQQVHLTDYHESVLTNVAMNVQLNDPSSSCATVSKLDFIQVAQNQDPSWEDRTFDIVIASDLLYEMEHAEYLPVAVEKLMENVFYFMIPLRPTHWDEVDLFERRMTQVGLVKRQVSEIECEEEEGIVRYRYYEYTR